MITDDDIRRVVPERSFATGLRYHLNGRVQELSVEADGTTIKALVLRSGIDRSRPGDAVRLAFDGRYALHLGRSGTSAVFSKADNSVTDIANAFRQIVRFNRMSSPAWCAMSYPKPTVRFQPKSYF